MDLQNLLPDLKSDDSDDGKDKDIKDLAEFWVATQLDRGEIRGVVANGDCKDAQDCLCMFTADKTGLVKMLEARPNSQGRLRDLERESLALSVLMTCVSDYMKQEQFCALDMVSEVVRNQMIADEGFVVNAHAGYLLNASEFMDVANNSRGFTQYLMERSKRVSSTKLIMQNNGFGRAFVTYGNSFAIQGGEQIYSGSSTLSALQRNMLGKVVD